LQLTIVKEEPWKLGQETTYIRLTKEELQEHDHQQSNPSVVKEKKKNKDSRVDARRHLKKGCNRWTSQSNIQEFFILPLDTKFYDS
jgi:hypothetical protein